MLSSRKTTITYNENKRSNLTANCVASKVALGYYDRVYTVSFGPADVEKRAASRVARGLLVSSSGRLITDTCIFTRKSKAKSIN